MIRSLSSTWFLLFASFFLVVASFFKYKRCPDEPALAKSKTLRDGLSGPLSIVIMILQMTVRKAGGGKVNYDGLETGEPLHIVVVGATAVNEEVRFLFVVVGHLSGLPPN